jgi:chorismate synthase
LKPIGASVRSRTDAIGRVKANIIDCASAEADPLRFLDPHFSPLAQREVGEAMASGSSGGGAVRPAATGAPAGLGESVLGKKEALLGGAFFTSGPSGR